MKHKIALSLISICSLLGFLSSANVSLPPHIEPAPDNGRGIAQSKPIQADAQPSANSSRERTQSQATFATAPLFTESIRAHKQVELNEKIVDNAIVTKDGQRYDLQIYKPAVIPNDPQANQSWVTSAKIDQAWDIPRGEYQTLLAIIDTGFALGHEEFENRWYANPGESGTAGSENPSIPNCTARGLAIDASCNLIDEDADGIIDNETGAAIYDNPSRLNCTDQGKALAKDCNLIDDDTNGLVDDYRGWDFINFDNSVQAGELNPLGDGIHHGTYVAGAAAATGNNGKGIAGVDWGTKILPIQALDDDAYGHSLSVARAIRYAAAQGADVISLSLGSLGADSYTRAAALDALAMGSVVVAASGNDGCDCISYPANNPEVVAVGALDTNNTPAAFSSWGTNLDIVAPGVNFRVPDWHNTNQTSAYASYISGTSLSTPIVSAMFTRLLSHQPNATSQQLIAAITENTNRFTLATNQHHSSTLGYGGLDALKATQRMTTAATPPQLLAFTPLSHGNTLSPGSPAQPGGTFASYVCTTPTLGTTPVYELTKGNSKFFSLSPAEVYRAQQSGYSSTFFTYVCLQQPHDQPSTIRNINIFQEFRNTLHKQ